MGRVPMNATKTTDVVTHGPKRTHNLPPKESGLRNAETEKEVIPKKVKRIGG